MKTYLIVAAILCAGIYGYFARSMDDAGETGRQQAAAESRQFGGTVNRAAAGQALPRLRERVATLREELRGAKGPGEAVLLGRDLDEAVAAVERAEREAAR